MTWCFHKCLKKITLQNNFTSLILECYLNITICLFAPRTLFPPRSSFPVLAHTQPQDQRSFLAADVEMPNIDPKWSCIDRPGFFFWLLKSKPKWMSFFSSFSVWVKLPLYLPPFMWKATIQHSWSFLFGLKCLPVFRYCVCDKLAGLIKFSDSVVTQKGICLVKNWPKL